MAMKIQTAPKSIVEDGKIINGMFDRPPANLNFGAAAPPGALVPRALWKSRLKEWLGFGIIHPDWYLCAFMTDAKYVTASNVTAYARSGGDMLKADRFRFGGSLRIGPDPYDITWRYADSGYSVEFRSDLRAGEHRIKIDIDRRRSSPEVRAEITAYEDMTSLQPLVVSMPLRGGHNAYTHKAPMRVSGRAAVNGAEFVFDPARDVTLMDEHRSFLPYATRWRWTTFAGSDAQGRLIALNLGDHDLVEDQRAWSENCLWIDGRLTPLGPAEFEFDRARHTKPWRISEVDGRAAVTFIPECDRPEKVSIGIIGMDYFQPCGRFEGFVVDDSGAKITFDDFFGVAEMMDAKW